MPWPPTPAAHPAPDASIAAPDRPPPSRSAYPPSHRPSRVPPIRLHPQYRPPFQPPSPRPPSGPHTLTTEPPTGVLHSVTTAYHTHCRPLHTHSCPLARPSPRSRARPTRCAHSSSTHLPGHSHVCPPIQTTTYHLPPSSTPHQAGSHPPTTWSSATPPNSVSISGPTPSRHPSTHQTTCPSTYFHPKSTYPHTTSLSPSPHPLPTSRRPHPFSTH